MRKSIIDGSIEKIENLKEKAMKAFDLRNEYKSKAREFMEDQQLAGFLGRKEKSMDWETFLKKTLEKENILTLEDAYLKIIENSKKQQRKSRCII